MTANKGKLQNSPLQGLVIAVPENRQLDILAALFERRQARVLRIPLLQIADHPDQQAVQRWLQAFLDKPPDLLVLYTGEGLRRLLTAAQRFCLREAFVEQLARVKKLIRGPKPARVLAELGLNAEITATTATTDGIIATLQQQLLLQGHISIQSYGADPVPELATFLHSQPNLTVSWVAPYVYGNQSDDETVTKFIRQLEQGQVDLVAFTSKAQLDALQRIAVAQDCARALDIGLEKTVIAAVGPVVAARLAEFGHPAAIMPQQKFFMKPLVRAAEKHFA